MATIVTDAWEIDIPADVLDLDAFRRWVHSDRLRPQGSPIRFAALPKCVPTSQMCRFDSATKFNPEVLSLQPFRSLCQFSSRS